MVDSSDFAQVMSEAEDIAGSANQRLTTAHVLLAMYTVENRAAMLLGERGVDDDRLLELLTAAPSEPDGLVRELRGKAREIAQSCGSPEADCLHALIGLTRVLRRAGPAQARLDAHRAAPLRRSRARHATSRPLTPRQPHQNQNRSPASP